MFLALSLLLLAGGLAREPVSLPRSLDLLYPPPSPDNFPSSGACSLSLLRHGLRSQRMLYVNDSKLSVLILVLCGDIHPHPGPALGEGLYPCGWCELKCGWSCDALCCDECDMWLHRSCMSMSQSAYERAGESNSSWRCYRCQTLNVNSFTYHSYNVPQAEHTTSSHNVPQAEHTTSSHISNDSVFMSNTSNVADIDFTFDPRVHSSPQSVHRSSSSLRTSESVSSCTSNPSQKKKDGNLRILTFNANSAKGKPAEIGNICDYIRPDIMVITETKFDKSVSASEFLPPNFSSVGRKDRTLHGGGVMIACRKDLVANEISLKGIKKDCELTFIRVSAAKGDPPLYVGAYYRSQTDNTANISLDGLQSAIEQVSALVRNSKSTVILAGDFNCPGICWDTLSVKPGSAIPSVSSKLIDVTSNSSLPLTQLQEEPTRQNSILDLFFTNNKSLVTSLSNIPGVSTANDHEALVADIKLKAQVTKSVPRLIFQWSKALWTDIKSETSLFANKFLVESATWSVDEQWDAIENHLNTMVSKFVPSKKSKSRTDQPWINTSLRRKCRKKQRLYNKWKKQKAQGRDCRSSRNAYQNYQKETNKLVKKAHNRYINNVLSDGMNSNSNKPFWRYIKSQKTESTGVSPLKDQGKIFSDPLKKAKILANQFKSVFTIDDQNARDTHPYGPSIPPIPDIEFSIPGVAKLLKGLDSKKASGPDQIPCRLLNVLYEELAPVFTTLYKTSYNTGKIPSIWKSAWVTPIFKKGAKCDAVNYRPVSLTCVACKQLEHIICSQIRKHLDKYQALFPNQHGFRKKLSCESQLLATTHDFLKRLDKKEKVDIAILDFSKAFDVVPHQRLLRKLRMYGLGGKCVSWISDFLDNRTQSVLVEGIRSHSGSPTAGDPVLSGVPQGTVMGPLLFLLFINDMPSVLDPSTCCRLFADDCLIYRSIKSSTDQAVFQRDLDALHNWGQTWGLSFNASKCNIMHLARSKSPQVRFYSLGGETLLSVSEAKYLGVTLSNQYGLRNSQWKAHISETATKASQRLGFLKRNLKGSPYKLRELAYTSLVRSSLEYCGAIWDPTNSNEANKLEAVQRRAARWARGAHGIISVTALMSELNWAPLADRRRNQRLCIFYKVLNGDWNISPSTLDIYEEPPVSRCVYSHNRNVKRFSGSDRFSPIWQGCILRTIPEWNSLPVETVSADSVLSFKSQLSASP